MLTTDRATTPFLRASPNGLASAAQDTTFVDIPGSAHMVQHTAPAATAAAIAAWTRTRG